MTAPTAPQDYAAIRNLVAVVSEGMTGRERRDVKPPRRRSWNERQRDLRHPRFLDDAGEQSVRNNA